MPGRSIALYADTGVGKTTQIGEYAKFLFKTTGRKTLLKTSDRGGYDSLGPLVRLGVVVPDELGPEDEPWDWIDRAATGEGVDDTIGCVAFDSGTGISEQLLSSAAKLAAKGDNIGGRPAPKFKVKAGVRTIDIPSNVDSHFMVVQGYMLDTIWKSSWLINKDIDVIWTFSTHRSESTDSEPIVGPKLAGKALTAAIPKWFRYTFRMVAVPQQDAPPKHVMFLQHAPGMTGSGAVSFSNARYPLDADDTLPVMLDPASLPEAIRLIEAGQEQAERKLREELGL